VEEMISLLFNKLFKGTILVLAIAVVAFFGRIVHHYMMESPLLSLGDVIIEGCQELSRSDILSLTQLEGKPNILSIELAELRRKVETNPWVERAEIKRIFPHRIWIKITERTPAAIILLERLYYIDAGGVIFARVPQDHRIKHPILTGLHRDDFKARPDETWRLVSNALRLINIARKGEVLSLEDISEIRMDTTLGISVYTCEGAIEVKFGLDHYGEKWKRLERVWKYLRRNPHKPAYIDCNYDKRVIVKMRESQAFHRKRSIQSS
jgi:cell division protein FtsQ